MVVRLARGVRPPTTPKKAVLPVELAVRLNAPFTVPLKSIVPELPTVISVFPAKDAVPPTKNREPVHMYVPFSVALSL